MYYIEDKGNNESWEPFQKGNGEIHISFDETNKQQKVEEVQQIIAAAKADGIETILDEGVAWLDNVTPGFIISFVDVPKDLMMKYNELMLQKPKTNMIYLDGDEMMFLDEKEIFLAYYEDIKDEIGELKCAWSNKKLNDSDVIVFNARDRSEEKIRCYIYERNDGEDDCAEARYICDVSVLRRDGGSCPVESNLPENEQLREIIKDYEERGFQVPNERLCVPLISCLDGTHCEQLIAVVSVLDSYGEDDEEEFEDEEEVEEGVR